MLTWACESHLSKPKLFILNLVFVPNSVTVALRKYLINYLSVQIFEDLDLKWNTQIVYQMLSENSQQISQAYFNYS